MNDQRVPFISTTLKVLTICLSAAIATPNALADEYAVVPGIYETQEAPGEFGLFAYQNPSGTYMWLIHERELADLVGSSVTGLTVRLDEAALYNWPANEVSFSNFNLQMGASVAPSAATNAFRENFVGNPSGGLAGLPTFPVNSWEATGNGPNPWGLEFRFTAPYLYQGGHVGILMDFVLGNGGFNGSFLDAAPISAPGYGTDYAAIWDHMDGSYRGSLGAAFTTIRLTTVPEPASAIALTGAFGALLSRRLRRQNNRP